MLLAPSTSSVNRLTCIFTEAKILSQQFSNILRIIFFRSPEWLLEDTYPITEQQDEPNLFLWIKFFLFLVKNLNKLGKGFSKVTKMHLSTVYTGAFRNSFLKVNRDKALLKPLAKFIENTCDRDVF